MKRTLFAVFAATLLIGSMVGGAAAASEYDTLEPETLNFSDDAEAPNPAIDVGTKKIVEYPVEWGGDLKYYDDSGEETEMHASVNESVDNPWHLYATGIADDELQEFPRKDDNDTASAVDASEWSKDMSSSSGSMTIADANPRGDVEGVQIAVDGQTSGDTARATYSNVSITSDPLKRVLATAVDVDALGSGATVTVEFGDGDGDYKQLEINASANATSDDVVATGVVDGAVEQTKASELTTLSNGTGDGTLDAIEQVQVVTTDGNATVTFSWIDAERKSRIAFGEQKVDTDDDDALETETIYDPSGQYAVASIDSLGSEFDDGTIYGLEVPVRHEAADLPRDDEHVRVKVKELPDDVPYNAKVIVEYRLNPRSAIDVSNSDMDLVMTQQWDESRYSAVELKEAAGDTDFGNVTYDTSVGDQFSAEGTNVTLDSTVQSNTEYVVKVSWRVTDGELEALTAGGGGGGVTPQSGGGPLGPIAGLIAGAVSLVMRVPQKLYGWLFG